MCFFVCLIKMYITSRTIKHHAYIEALSFLKTHLDYSSQIFDQNFGLMQRKKGILVDITDDPLSVVRLQQRGDRGSMQLDLAPYDLFSLNKNTVLNPFQ